VLESMLVILFILTLKLFISVIVLTIAGVIITTLHRKLEVYVYDCYLIFADILILGCTLVILCVII